MDEILLETVVGSHIWQMATPDSDMDIFRVYKAPTRDILLGKVPRSKFEEKIDGKDITYHEIGTVYHQILKSNINFVIGLFSPIVVQKPLGNMIKFLIYARHVVDSQIYNSIHGMAISNYKKYGMEQYGDRIPEATYNKILRFVQFGIDFLKTNEFQFKPFRNGNEELMRMKIQELDEAYQDCKHPSTMSYTVEKLADVLIDIRMENY